MSSRELALLRFWLSVGFLGCGIVLYGCLMPSPPQVLSGTYADKIEHFGAYAVLGTWFAGILAPHYLRVFLGLLAFGVLIEILQGLTGYRDAQVGDAVADGLGAMVGIGLARLGAMRWLGYIDRRVEAKRNTSG
ncbi:VanZ family protein [Salinisphaera aquimarina]|uniref:VanZ family protein n=1 Tax=Salinisphaera aquimarina TaxID=2094031 RepID=A0ABV7EUQ7_9GAMM